MTDNECTTYMYNVYELFIPSMIITKRLCTSYMRTQLFIMSVARLVVYIVLYYTLQETNVKYPMLDKLLLSVIILNIIYVLVVIAKKPNIIMGRKQIETDIAILTPN